MRRPDGDVWMGVVPAHHPQGALQLRGQAVRMRQGKLISLQLYTNMHIFVV